MKRLFVILLTLLAVIAALAPPLIGRGVAEQLPVMLDQWQAKLPNHTVIVIGHERHWFSSATEIRVIENEPQRYGVVSELAELIPFADQPAWMLNIEWAHGPIPLAAVSNADISLKPAWLRATIHVAADTGPSGRQTFPGLLKYQLGLLGKSTLHSALRTGQLADRFDDAEIRWQNIAGSLSANAAITRLSAELRSEPVSLTSPDGLNMSAKSIDLTLAANTNSNPPGGKLQLDVGKAELRGRDFGLVLDTLGITGATTLRAGKWNSDLNLQTRGAQTPLGLMTMTIDAGLDGMSHAWLQAQTSNVRSTDWQAQLLALANEGANLEVTALRLQLGDSKELLAQAKWHARSGDTRPAATLGELLLSSEASFDVRAPKKLTLQLMVLLDEQTRPIVISMLKTDADDYTVTAILRDGIITINGYPLPLISVVNGG